MMSKVSSNGPAFLLRIRRASSPSVVMSAYFHVLDGEHLVRIVWRDDMVHAEPVDRTTLEIGGAVRAGHAGDEAAPLGDGQVQGLMTRHRRDGAGDLLRCGGCLEHQAQLVRAYLGDGLERSHGAVLAVDAHVEHVLSGSGIAAEHVRYPRMDA